jgi:hypothetical protein
MVHWLREHWLGLLVVAGLIASPIYAHEDAKRVSRDAAAIVETAAVKRCVDSAPRAAYEVAFQYQAAEARAAAGDVEVAERYRQLANAAILTVAAPEGYRGSKQLVEVRYRDGKAELTQHARELQRVGCEQAYAR